MSSRACLNRYNTALVKQYGPSAVAAVYNTATYGSSPPYVLTMQAVRMRP